MNMSGNDRDQRKKLKQKEKKLLQKHFLHKLQKAKPQGVYVHSLVYVPSLSPCRSPPHSSCHAGGLPQWYGPPSQRDQPAHVTHALEVRPPSRLSFCSSHECTLLRNLDIWWHRPLPCLLVGHLNPWGHFEKTISTGKVFRRRRCGADEERTG